MTEKEAYKFICGLFDSFNNQDWETFFGTYVWDNCKFINGNGLHQGRDKMVQYWDDLLKTKEEKLCYPFNVFVKENQIVRVRA